MATGATPAPPFANRRWIVASESRTGTPKRRNIFAATDLPIAMEPVRPMIFI